MRPFLIIFAYIIFCAGAAFGQAGGIGLYVDQDTFVQCDYDDNEAALVPVYVVHKFCPGATASQWRVISGGGFNCTFVGETHNCFYLAMDCGNTRDGISLPYGGCVDASNLLIATMNYFCMGDTPTCAWLEVVPDPDAPTGTIEVIDCSYVKHAAVGSKIFFNNDGTCGQPCGLPTQTSSWGQVKALYR